MSRKYYMSKNLTFEGCSFEALDLQKCSNISINNCSFNKRLDIAKTQNSYIANSSIEFLNIGRSLENHFKSCSISRISNISTRANTFENIKTSVEDFYAIIEKGLGKVLLGTLFFPIIGIGLLFLAITRFGGFISTLQLWLLIGGIPLMVFFEILIILALYRDHQKMRRYPPNKIL
ncbi:MAG: hypothetical protein ACFE9S_19280 [Candidatus Hermodarchaeota archaeon]